MKISELVNRLLEVQSEHGDIEVCHIVNIVDSCDDYASDVNGDTICITDLRPNMVYFQEEKKSNFYDYQYPADIDTDDEDWDITEWKKICTF